MIDIFKKLLRPIYHWFKLNLLADKVKYIPLEELNHRALIRQDSINEICYLPISENNKSYTKTYKPVDIKLYELSNIYANVNSSSFLAKSEKLAYIETFPYVGNQKLNYISGYLLYHDSIFAYFKVDKINQIRKFDKVLFLGGNGSFNFYHWMIEIAPKLLCLSNDLLNKYEIDTIVVNDKVRDIENFQWIFQKSIQHLEDINVVYSNQSETFYANKLYLINTFNQTIFNFFKPKDLPFISSIYNKAILIAFVERLSSSVDTGEDDSPSKIFILRNNNSISSYNKRHYNEDEVFHFFEKNGFVGVYPDKMTLLQQIQLFKNADFIVGPSGSSWANLIFAKPYTKAISWLPESAKFFDTYSSLAGMFNIDMRFLIYQTFESDNLHSSYSLSIDKLKATYESILSI